MDGVNSQQIKVEVNNVNQDDTNNIQDKTVQSRLDVAKNAQSKTSTKSLSKRATEDITSNDKIKSTTTTKKASKVLSVISKVGEAAGAILGIVSVAFPPVAIAAGVATIVGVAADIGTSIINHKQQ